MTIETLKQEFELLCKNHKDALEKLLVKAYVLGRDETLEEMRQYLNGGVIKSDPEPDLHKVEAKQKRVAKGVAETLIIRALARNPNGITLKNFTSYAETEEEKSISYYTISSNVRYLEKKGKVRRDHLGAIFLKRQPRTVIKKTIKEKAISDAGESLQA